MRDVLKAMAEELRAGRRCALCAILQTQGSAPRKAGTLMLVRKEGFAGTVGGGLPELHTLQRARELLPAGGNETLCLSSRPSEGDGIDASCGGSMTVGVYLADPARDAACAEAAWAAARDYAPGWLQLRMNAAGVPEALTFVSGTEEEAGTACLAGGPKLLPGEIRGMPLSGAVLSVPVTRAGRCVIFGGGHVGAAVSKLLVTLGWETLVIDDRPSLAVPERFLGAEVRCMPYTQAASLPLRRTDCVLVMTSGHESDFEAETAALDAGVFYIGSLGSHKKAAALRERLLGAGYTARQLSIVHTPIGLDIGAETPAEIAVSIAAELIAVRSGREGRKA